MSQSDLGKSDLGKSDLGQTIHVAGARFERLLPGPLERVWAHLTETDRLKGWYGEAGTIEPREGGAVRLSGGHIRGVVTQWKPNLRLAYTWNVFAPDETDSPYPESYLTLELAAEGEEVRLVLTHLPVLDRFEAQNKMGWATFLDMLGASLRGEPEQPRRAYMEANAAKYGIDLNALVR